MLINCVIGYIYEHSLSYVIKDTFINNDTLCNYGFVYEQLLTSVIMDMCDI